jgi:lipid II:glycine glycyltransferase (peptidoglycan interpeptide bridge formation enzyme)
MLVAPAVIDANITKHIRAEFVTQRLLKFVTQWLTEFACYHRPLAIVRGPARNANKFKAEGEPYKGQRKYGWFHRSHQQLKS